MEEEFQTILDLGILKENITEHKIGNEININEFDVMYMMGGNTFYLLNIIRKTGFDKNIKEFINSGKIYVGSSAGSEILKSIAKERDDIIYLGPDVADLKIGKLKIRLFHGSGGNAYAKSYKLQKYLDTIPLEERPDILQTGHIHQSFYMKQDKTHCFQTSCLEDQTPYCRGMGLANDKSCWWVDIDFDNKGRVYKITPELETFGDKKIFIKK